MPVVDQANNKPNEQNKKTFENHMDQHQNSFSFSCGWSVMEKFLS